MNLMRMLYKTATLFVVVFAFVACDNEYSTVGGEIIENPSNLELQEVEVTAYNKNITSVQTNNLSNYLLGVYNHPIYGQSTASILSQLSLPTNNPTFGVEPELDSVVLTIPYFSTEGDSDEDGNIQYALDSIYGNTPIKLTIQESNYFLNNYDPEEDFEESQKYYSDQQELFQDNLVGDIIYENESFLPSSQPIVSYKENDNGEQDTISSGPALRVKLPVAYFEQKIIEKEGSSVLSNNNNFKNYLRGMFIKAEATAEDGTMMLLDLNTANAGVELFYTSEVETTTDGETETTRTRRSYELDFGTTIVNTFVGEYPGDVLQAIQESNEESGAEKLFVDGGEGTVAVIELFEDEEQLAEIKENNWLINEANLTFYVDQDFAGDINEPTRLYLYDLDNNRVLADYSFAANFISDGNELNPSVSLSSFSGPLERDEDGNGIRYKLNLTQHVNNIIEGETDNVRLGLVITQNINITNTSAVRYSEDVEFFPSMGIITPKGTVLHGNLSDNEDKRLKLRIYYTEVN
jgi:hypothetical protein